MSFSLPLGTPWHSHCHAPWSSSSRREPPASSVRFCTISSPRSWSAGWSRWPFIASTTVSTGAAVLPHLRAPARVRARAREAPARTRARAGSRRRALAEALDDVERDGIAPAFTQCRAPPRAERSTTVSPEHSSSGRSEAHASITALSTGGTSSSFSPREPKPSREPREPRAARRARRSQAVVARRARRAHLVARRDRARVRPSAARA